MPSLSADVLFSVTDTLIFGAVLAVVILVYWRLKDGARNALLSICGVVGLSALAPGAAAAMAALTLIVYLSIRFNTKAGSTAALLILGLGFAAYKLTANGGVLDQGVGLVGLVYAVPRASHILIDTRFRKLEPPSLATLISYLWFFPLLLVGPIYRLDEFRRSVRRRRFDATQFGLGLERILVGLVSVKILADWFVSERFGRYVDGVPNRLDGRRALLETVEYGLNLYFSFAGWSAVAIGIAALFGFVVPENFIRPFGQRNIREFWRHWHITLTRWTRDYVFQPIAAITRQGQVAIIATMFAIALWHEFSGRYVLWGLWHAAGLAAHRRFEIASRKQETGSFFPERIGEFPRRVVATGVTVIFVFLSFTITRSVSISDIWREFGSIFGGAYL